MATIDQLEIQIKADIADLKRRLDEAKQRLTGLKDGSTRAAAGVKTVGTSAKSTGIAVMNLNRVVQDAPFGLVAIQNNIEPLLTSFNRLKGEVGGFGAAVKVLGKSMLGPAGLIAGLSLAAFFLPKIIRSLKEGSAEAREFAKSLNEIIKVDSGLKQFETSFRTIRADLASVTALARKELQKFIGEGGFSIAGRLFGGDEKTRQRAKDLLALEKKLRDEYEKMLPLARAAALAEEAGLRAVEKTDKHKTSIASKTKNILDDAILWRRETARISRDLESAEISLRLFEKAQEKVAGIVSGPGSPTKLRGVEDAKRQHEALKNTLRASEQLQGGLRTTDLLANSIADGFAQMAVNIRSVGDIAKSVFKEMIASLVRIAAFRFFGGLLGGIFGGPAGAAAGAAAGGSLSIGGSDAGQSAFTPLVASISVDMRDLVIGIERQRVEQRRLGVKIG